MSAQAKRAAWSWPWRVLRGHWRVFAGALCAALAAVVIPQVDAVTRTILAWDVGVIVFLAIAASLFITSRAERMEADAAAQEEGEWTVFWLTMAAIAFSFAAIIEEFAGTKDVHPGARSLHLIVLAVTLASSWLVTHVLFALRYAHEYYERDGDGELYRGLAFPQEDRPDYSDFLYFALVIGMTFQVSDVQITSRGFRRLASVHGALSFVYNTIIVALTVNLAAGMI